MESVCAAVWRLSLVRRLLGPPYIILVSVAAMETRRYSLAVVSSLLLSGFWRKDTKISLCLSQPGERSSQGLMPSSQVGKLLSFVHNVFLLYLLFVISVPII